MGSFIRFIYKTPVFLAIAFLIWMGFWAFLANTLPHEDAPIIGLLLGMFPAICFLAALGISFHTSSRVCRLIRCPVGDHCYEFTSKEESCRGMVVVRHHTCVGCGRKASRTHIAND